MSTSDRDDLEKKAKDWVESLPGETALGNPDPAGGSDRDPKQIDEQADSHPDDR